MTTFPATEAKNKFGELLEAAYREPVEISKKGRPVAVLLSLEAYEEIQERLGEEEKVGNFLWLREWRKNASKDRKGEVLDEASYYEQVDQKYGR